MYYVSTRDHTLRYTAAQAIEQGLSREGGLFLPETFPQLPDLKTLLPMNYQQRAAAIMGLFLDGFSGEELETFASKAYGGGKFDCPEVAPVRELHCKTHMLELWHGPTCAFKDMALQMLPHLLTASMAKNGEEKTVCILVATSGDTGKAALEVSGMWPAPRLWSSIPRTASRTSSSSRWSPRRARMWVFAPWWATSTMPRPASRRSSPILPSGMFWRDGAMCSPRPIPSTGDAFCPRWSTTSPPTATSSGGKAQAWRQVPCLRAHGQLRQHPGRLLRQEDGASH